MIEPSKTVCRSCLRKRIIKNYLFDIQIMILRCPLWYSTFLIKPIRPFWFIRIILKNKHTST